MDSKSKIFFVVVFLTIFFSLKISEAHTIFPNEEEYQVSVDKVPVPVGGYEGIMKKIIYPAMAIQTRTEGKVYMLVYLNENGDVEEAKIVKGIGGGCDEEAVKAVKKSKFIAATQNGALVKTKFAVALNFKLP